MKTTIQSSLISLLCISTIVLSACSRDIGEKLPAFDYDFYFTSAITQAEAAKVANYLLSNGFYKYKHLPVQLAKSKEIYEFRVKAADLDSSDVDFGKKMAIVAQFVSINALNNERVDVHITDEKFNTLRVIKGLKNKDVTN